MKTFAKSIFAVAAAVIAFAACQKVENYSVSSKTVKFVANSIDTKAAFGTPEDSSYPVFWTENDTKAGIIVNDETTKKEGDVFVSSDKKSAAFAFDLGDIDATSYIFKVVTPASGLVGNSTTKGINLGIPASQTPSENSVDEAAMIFYAVSSEYNEIPEEPIELSFSHFTAYGKLSIVNLDAAAKISAIDLTASEDWVGRWNVNTADGTFVSNTTSATISLNTTKAADNWFACAPVDLGGKTIKISVITDKGVYEKTITIPAGKKFESGKIAKFSVDFSGVAPKADLVYTLVTSSDQLTEDSQVIIVAKGANVAMGTTGTNNRPAVDIVKTDNTIVNPSETVQTLTLKPGTKAYTTLSLYTGTGYLYAASSSSNYLKLQTTLNDNGSFSVRMEGEDGNITLKAQGSNTRNLLRYNSSSNLFSCYSSGQDDIVIYKLNGSGTDKPLVIEGYVPTIPTFASMSELLNSDTASGTTVTVTLTNEVITRFYMASGKYKNGVFFNVDGEEVEIYCRDVPAEWEVGGMISGTVTCPWKEYNGTWELCPDNYDDFTYTPAN